MSATSWLILAAFSLFFGAMALAGGSERVR
jgi:hypothetical protein